MQIDILQTLLEYEYLRLGQGTLTELGHGLTSVLSTSDDPQSVNGITGRHLFRTSQNAIMAMRKPAHFATRGILLYCY